MRKMQNPNKRNLKYYDDLLNRSKHLGEYDLCVICLQFKEYLNSLNDIDRRNIFEWYYILLLHHQLVSGVSNSTIPYNPGVIPSSYESNSLKYDLSKLPLVLQEILIVFMYDCIGK